VCQYINIFNWICPRATISSSIYIDKIVCLHLAWTIYDDLMLRNSWLLSVQTISHCLYSLQPFYWRPCWQCVRWQYSNLIVSLRLFFVNLSVYYSSHFRSFFVYYLILATFCVFLAIVYASFYVPECIFRFVDNRHTGSPILPCVINYVISLYK
jgi:hypothetical protein